MEIWHNPRCSKSRQALALVEQNTADFEVVEYLKIPITQKRLKEVAQKLDMLPRDMMRRNEALYKELNLAEASDAALFKAMSDNPILIERPIIIRGSNAVIGRPPENVLSLF
ncbi:arsenate reductase (glutaredoxin) [Parvularcula sp. IMCC14364]|uniref:arsenate reductase (glutaredoxin) n=1 Tax=Parvularcula sp. IMCC14364 TaxID=3067902 RepID=UPI002740C024|nr:arsenate reductase (glutaredoxin) [Parvularcula sp. IMCC14364]